MIEILFSGPLVHAIGVTLIAFLWQGSAIGVIAFVILASLRRATAQARYLTACVALAAMAIAPVITLSREMIVAPPAVADHNASSTSAVSPAPPRPDGALQIRTAGQSSDRADAALPLIVEGWSIGVLALTLHVLFGWIQIGRLRRDARPIDDVSWMARLAPLASRLGIVRHVRLLESLRVDVPAVIGWLRPAILLPASALSGLTTTHLDAILAHELAHIRRADFLVNLAQRAVEIALFYHPAVWWISSEIRREREHCCDDVAAECCGSRREYAAALGALAMLGARPPALVIGVQSGDVVGRIRRLVDPRAVPARRWSGGHVMIVIPALLLVASVSGATTQVAVPPVPVVAAPAVAPMPASVPAPVTMPTPSAAPAPVHIAKAPAPLPSPAPVVDEVPPAQATGRVYGEVRDHFGGVIPGVTITTHTSGNSPDRSTTTNARGQFSIDSLPAGAYTVQAGSLPGFRTVSVNVTIAADAVAVPFQLSVGDLTEHISVVGDRNAALARPAAVARPQTCKTSAECVDAARAAYANGDVTTTDALLSQAVDLRRSEDPGLFLAAPPRPPFAISNSDVVRVGGSIRPPNKVVDVTPLYPPEALAGGVDGTVVIDATLAKDGSIWEAHVVTGRPELGTSALDAVHLWKFTPTLLDGIPVAANATITISFDIRGR